MLVSLAAEGFRNLAPFTWEPGPGSHLLLGGNGAGKTSLLEAVYALATTKSFRTAQLADCVRHGEAGFELRGEVEGEARSSLFVAWRSGPGGGKERSLNGKASALSEHLAVQPVVAWTSADAELTTGPPGLRRRFLDRGIVGLRPVALDLLGRYRQALRQKRQLLADGGGGRRTAELLPPWNDLLAASGAEIVRQRARYAELLAVSLAAVAAEAALPFPPLSLAYRPSPRNGLEGEAAIRERLERLAGREIERRLPLVGPHRDDLLLLWGGHPLRGTVSAGERKAAGLLLLAAHSRVLAGARHPPVILLDDADTELSPASLASLWGVFAAAEQLFASSNRPQAWTGLDLGTVHAVEAGRVSLSALRPTP